MGEGWAVVASSTHNAIPPNGQDPGWQRFGHGKDQRPRNKTLGMTMDFLSIAAICVTAICRKTTSGGRERRPHRNRHNGHEVYHLPRQIIAGKGYGNK